MKLPMPQPRTAPARAGHPSAATKVVISATEAIKEIERKTLDNPNKWIATGSSLVYYGGIALCAYHGWRRNDSAMWAAAWGAFGAAAPVLAPWVAATQGFAKPKRRGRGR